MVEHNREEHRNEEEMRYQMEPIVFTNSSLDRQARNSPTKVTVGYTDEETRKDEETPGRDMQGMPLRWKSRQESATC